MIDARGVPMLTAAFDEIIRRTARAAAGRARPHSARRVRVRRRDGRRRRRHHQHSDQAARHRAAARRQQEGAVRLHRHRAAGEGQHQLHRHGHARGRALFAQSAARSGRAEQPGPDRDRRHRRAARHADQFALPRGGRGARQHGAAHRGRGDRRARARDPRSRGRRRERREHHRGVLRPRSAPRPRLRLSRNARRRLRRTLHQGRQGRRAGAHHQHVEPPGGIDRDGVSAAGRELRLRRGFRRRRQISRRARAAPRGAPGRPHHDVLRTGRALRQPAVGPVRRRQRRHGQVRQAQRRGSKCRCRPSPPTSR